MDNLQTANIIRPIPRWNEQMRLGGQPVLMFTLAVMVWVNGYSSRLECEATIFNKWHHNGI
jgi:hypothetical protein